MSVVEKFKVSVSEYLSREASATVRHEYHDGEILAMSGTTFEHSQVAINLYRESSLRLKGKPCQPLDSNIRVRLASENRYVYPDVTVLCGAPEFDPQDARRMTITNPSVIIEVLSESTEHYDRGEKFAAYRSLAGLREYVLVSQWDPCVETYFRHEDGRWTIRRFEGMDATVDLPSLQIEIPLREIYLNVTFQPRPKLPDER